MLPVHRNLFTIFIYPILFVLSILLTGCIPQTQKLDACSCAESLNQPNMSQTSLLVWANEAAVTAYTYNFVDYKKALQAASQYFTPEGWKTFIAFLNSSGTLSKVINKKLLVTAVATGAPVIIEQQIMNRVYTWKVQIPLLITYQSPSQISHQPATVTMLITRTPTNIGTRGLGIKQFTISPAPKLE